jgi:hypothetical protein
MVTVKKTTLSLKAMEEGNYKENSVKNFVNTFF